MNKVSEWLRDECYTPIDADDKRLVAYAELVERLVMAAKAAHDHNGECPCVYADDMWNELNDALAAIQEGEVGNE